MNAAVQTIGDVPTLTGGDVKIRANNVSIYYGAKQAIDDVSIEVPSQYVTSFIGPSGCGKSTFLRALNRMNEIERAHV